MAPIRIVIPYFPTHPVTMADQFHKGLDNIRAAIDSALREHRIEAAQVSHDSAGDVPSDIAFTLKARGESAIQSFAQEEIEDSGEAIDHTAAIKVRLLVSPFVQ